MTNPQVRLSRATDSNDILALIRESHHEEQAIPLRFDANSAFEIILRALRGEAVIGVIEGENEIESACYLEATRPWYSSHAVVNSLFFYTRPDYRKSTNSKALLTWARKQAERLGCPMQLEIPTTEAAKPKFNLCERILGNPAGMSFVYAPNPESPTEIGDIEVQAAQPEDEPEVFDVIRELAAENGAYQPDEEQAIPLLRNALNGDGVIGVIRPSKEIEAIIFLTISRAWFSKDRFIDEYFLFSRPQYRKTKDARALVQFAKRQADRLNLPLRIGIISKIELERKLALYERMLGGPASNAHFLYRPH